MTLLVRPFRTITFFCCDNKVSANKKDTTTQPRQAYMSLLFRILIDTLTCAMNLFSLSRQPFTIFAVQTNEPKQIRTKTNEIKKNKNE